MSAAHEHDDWRDGECSQCERQSDEIDAAAWAEIQAMSLDETRAMIAMMAGYRPRLVEQLLDEYHELQARRASRAVKL